jgi:hypothetical protein
MSRSRVLGCGAILFFVLGSLWLGYTRIRYEVVCRSTDSARDYVETWAAGNVFRELSRMEPPEIWARSLHGGGLDVRVVSLELRGDVFGDVISKVEYTVNGQLPPDGKRYHYYTTDYSFLSSGYAGRAWETYPFLYRAGIWRGCRWPPVPR